MDEITSRALATTASSLIVEPVKHVLDTWLKPKLAKIKQKQEINEKLELFAYELFSEYIQKTFEEQSFISVIALGLQQIKVDQIYVPLTLVSEEREEEYTITQYPSNLARKYKRIVIEDTAGMGKSTLMKKMFLSVIAKNLGIPIFIELRNISKDKDILNHIFESLSKLTEENNKELILALIERGDFIFFFDGYDEIPFHQKQEVTLNLKKFISSANKNTFFLTSRHDDSLMSFGQFKKFQIKDLEDREAYKLLRNCDKVSGLNLANRIIVQIEELIEIENFETLKSFLANPMLVSFLYTTFKYKKDIPSLKSDLYRKVFDALYEVHDLSKDSYKREKYSGLTSGDMQKVLMKLGFLCLRENENDYDKGKLLKLIGQAKNSPYLQDVKEENILKDFLETVPLFSKVGLSYKWIHKSFMDYFSANFIDNQQNREEILNKILKSNNFTLYMNMLDFYYEIDRELFDKVFIYPLISKFVNFIESFGIDSLKQPVHLEYLELTFNKIYLIGNKSEVDWRNEVEIKEEIKKELEKRKLIFLVNLIIMN